MKFKFEDILYDQEIDINALLRNRRATEDKISEYQLAMVDMVDGADRLLSANELEDLENSLSNLKVQYKVSILSTHPENTIRNPATGNDALIVVASHLRISFDDLLTLIPDVGHVDEVKVWQVLALVRLYFFVDAIRLFKEYGL